MKKLLPLIISAALGSLSTSAWADSLATIYDQAKQNDPQLLGAAAQKDAALEAVNSNRATLLPQVNLAAGYNLTRGSTDLEIGDRDPDQNVLSAGVKFSQQLYNRSSWITLDTAEKTARKADAEYASVQQGLILRSANAYFEVLRAKDNLAFVRAEKAAVARQLEQTKQRFEVGLSAITDVHDAQAQFDAVLASEVLAENTLTNTYEALREITGQEHTSIDPLDTKRFSASRSKSDINTLIEEAGKKNLTLLVNRIAVDIEKEKISLSEASNLPTISLDGGYSLSDTSGTDNDSRSNAFTLGVNLAMPLYTGGKLDSLTKQQEFAYVAASQNLEAVYRGVVKEVRAQNNNINATIGALRAYEQSVVSAKSALEATEAGFDVGTRTIVDVLDSTRRLYDANKNLSNARYDYILSVLKLRQAVGTLSEQDIIDIDAGLKRS